MKKSRGLQIAGVLMLSLAALLASCGGGGTDTSRSGGTDATLTASNAAQVGDSVIQAAKLVAPTAALGQVKTADVSADRKPVVLNIFQTILPVVRDQQGNSKGSSALKTQPCPSGDIELTSVSLQDLSGNVTADVNVNNCTVETATMNGSLEVTFPASAISDPQHVSEFTITTSNLTYSDSVTNDAVTLSDNFTMKFENISYSGNTVTGGTVTMGGSVTGTIDNEPINVECDSFGVRFNSPDTTGINVWVSGRISAQCIGGWVTMSTNTPIFFPLSGTCPTNGEVVVTANGSTMTMDIAANESITIYLNGTVINTYSDCNKVKGFCS